MRVAVSGATGYLGLNLIRALLAQGETVLGVARKKNDSLECLLSEYKDRFCVCELASSDLLYEMQSFCPQVVYSTTCCYESDAGFLEKTVDSNYVFPFHLLKCLMRVNNGSEKRFINISTSLPAELNLYTLTKKQFSELGKFYSSHGDVQFVNVLLESFYGSDEPKSRFIQRSIENFLLGKDVDATMGTQHRDYVSVLDVIDALVFLARAGTLKTGYDSISLGSGEAPSIREILEFLKEATGSKSTINFGAVPSRKNEPSTKADLIRLREIGYTKKMTFWKDGMRDMVMKIKNECSD